jgi:phosphate uptake regulator
MSENDDPVERKVQLTGGSTYTVSLPKAWAGDRDIEPGSHVLLYFQGDQLVLTKGDDAPDATAHETTIQGGDSDPATLAHAITAAYIAGCDRIGVEGLTDRDKRRTAIQAIRGFVGLEVMTEDEDSLEARTMLDVEDLSPAQTLAQLERTALEMQSEAISAVLSADGELGQQVARQDDDVDRLFALVSRGFQQSMIDPAVSMGNGNLTPFEYYMAARQLERIADHAEKTANIAGRLSEAPPSDLADELQEFGDQSRRLVRDALSGLLDGKAEESGAFGSLIADAEELLTGLAALDEQVYERNLDDGYLLGLVIDSLVRTTEYAVNIAESGLQARHRGSR